MTRISFDDTSRPKALARRLRSSLLARGASVSLSALRELVSQGFGHAGWHALSRACRPGAGDGPDWDVEAVRERLVAALVAAGVDPATASSASLETLPARRPGGRAPVGDAAAFERWLDTVSVVTGRDDDGRPTLAFAQAELDAAPDDDDDEDGPDPWFESLDWCADGSLSSTEALSALCGAAILAAAPPLAPLPAGWVAPRSDPPFLTPEGDGVGGFLDGFSRVTGRGPVRAREACLAVLEVWGRRRPELASFLDETGVVASLAACLALPDAGSRGLAATCVGTRAWGVVGALLLRAPLLGGVFAASRYPFPAVVAEFEGDALALHVDDLLVGGGLPFGDRRLPALGRDGLSALSRFPFRLPAGCESSDDAFEENPDVAATAVVIVAGLARIGVEVAWTRAEATALVAVASLCAPLLNWDRHTDDEIDGHALSGVTWEDADDEGYLCPTVSPRDLVALLVPHAGRFGDFVARHGLATSSSPSYRMTEGADLLGLALDSERGLGRGGRAARLRRRLLDHGLDAFVGEALGLAEVWHSGPRRGPRARPVLAPHRSVEGLPPPPLLSTSGPEVPRPKVVTAFMVRVHQSYAAVGGAFDGPFEAPDLDDPIGS